MKHAFLIARLRSTLFKNSLRTRANRLGFVLGAIGFVALSLLTAAMSVALGALTEVTFSRHVFTPLLSIVLAGILIVWQLTPILTASFGSDLNVSKFRIYPLSTRALFLIDIMLGFFDPVSAISMILLAGIFAGVVIASPRSAPAAAFGLLMFVATNIVLTRYLQRILAGFFASRRRKELLAIFIFLLCLTPQALISMQGRRPAARFSPGRRAQQTAPSELQQWRRDIRVVGSALRWTPPGVSAAALNTGSLDFGSECLLVLAGVAFLAAISGLKYRQLTRDYLALAGAGKSGRKPHPAHDRAPHGAGSLRTSRAPERALPLGSDPGSDASIRGRPVLVQSIETLLSPVSEAVFEKELKYLYRSPRVLLIAISPVVLTVLFTLPAGPFGRPAFGGQYKLGGFLLYSMIVSFQLFGNAFGFDWHGAKLYFFSPARGKSVLIGKNLAAATTIALQSIAIVIAFSLVSGPPGIGALINAAFVVMIGLPISLAVGNYVSVMYPRGVDFSKLHGKAYSSVSGMIGCTVLPGLAIVIGVGPLLGWLLDSQLAVYVVFLLEAAVAIVSYIVTLNSAGAMLEGRAEQLLQGLFTTR